jgi:hypothetical protein
MMARNNFLFGHCAIVNNNFLLFALENKRKIEIKTFIRYITKSFFLRNYLSPPNLMNWYVKGYNKYYSKILKIAFCTNDYNNN